MEYKIVKGNDQFYNEIIVVKMHYETKLKAKSSIIGRK